MTLCKYQPVNPKSLENLVASQLWLSSPGDFNDPYDSAYLIGTNTGHTDHEDFDIARELSVDKEAFDKTYLSAGAPNDAFRKDRDESIGKAMREISRLRHQAGIACFATDPRNPLMWAHYADGHRGFCLVFDGEAEPFASSAEVNYARVWPPFHFAYLRHLDSQMLLSAALRTKADWWRYEGERRIIRDSRGPLPYDRPALLQVHFGARMPKPLMELVFRSLPEALWRNNNVQRLELRPDSMFSTYAVGDHYF